MRTKLPWLVILISFSFSGCGLFLGWVFRPCDVDINKRYVKASCGLTNGVYFEELVADSIGADGLPVRYTITTRFMCYNPGIDGVQTYWPNKLYFEKQNEHYRWTADTVNYTAIRNGRDRDITKTDESTGETAVLSFIYGVASVNSFVTCPVKFKPDTWYFLSVMDPSLSGIYMYVSNKMRFTVYEIESGISPI